ncbi:MAG: serine hydrolase [Gemmatimonadota bacterium]
MTMKTTTAHTPLALVALVFCTLHPRAAAGQHVPTEGQLAYMLRYIVEDGETPGIVLGALEADGTQKIVAWGRAGPDAAMEPGSRFEIGDLTMTFTGTLLAEMAGRGEVAPDDPVSKYLPADVAVPSVDGRQITLDDLARHISGLPPGRARRRSGGRSTTRRRRRPWWRATPGPGPRAVAGSGWSAE